jgi:hypothetical protein
MWYVKPALASLFILLASTVEAQVTQTIGAGTAVSGTPDRIATFDNVVTGTDLTAYTEDKLSITIPDTDFDPFDPTGGSGLGGFSGGYFYPNFGANAATVIKTTDSQKMYGLEFNVGNGFGPSTTHFAYFVFDGGMQIATGAFDIIGGSVLGFSDPNGFDQIDIGAYSNLALAQSATISSYQAGAIDNVKVRLTPTATPEPGSIALLLSGMMGAGFAFRRRKRETMPTLPVFSSE